MLSWLTGVGVGVGLGDGTDILDAIWPREDEVAAVVVASSMEMQAPFPTSATTTITTTATTLPPLPSFGFSRAMEMTAAAAVVAAAAVAEEQVSSNEAFAQAASRAAGQSSQPGLHSFRQLKTSTRFESSLLPPPPLPPLPLFPRTHQPHPLPFTSMSFPSPSQSEATASASVPVSFNAETETRLHSACHPLKRQMQEESPGYMDLQVQCTSEDSSEIKLTEGRGRRRRRKRKRKRRRRAAEVHNLSERRRRERINNKMKALQELIPNSNKMDKASVLDEAIEYMKLLQSQLKMLCMMVGSNVIVPPMMDPMACAYVWTNTHHGLGLEGTIMPTNVYTPSFHAEGSSAQQGPPMPTNLYPQALYHQVSMNLSMMNGYMTPPPHLQHEEQHYNMHQTNKHATQ